MTDIETLELQVRRDDLGQVRWAEAQTRADQPLDPGDVLLRLDRFALTSNNITYGVVGELMQYWSFFPAPDGWGRLPVWGFADVVQSRAPGVNEGERVYGFLPISTYLRVRAAGLNEQSFKDVSEHRKSLPAVYQRYQRVERADAATEDLRAVLQPLFGTGYLIDDWLIEQQLFGARQVVFASASSKTALSAAFCLSRRPQRDFEVIGLTSTRNRSLCERVGYYDRVVDYTALQSLPAATPTVYVDMAADSELTKAVHAHFAEALRYSSLVGMTHRPESLAPPGGLVGPAPQLFFAPAQIDLRSKAWGPEVFWQRLGEAQQAFYASAQTWLEIAHGAGRAAIEAGYLRVLEGRAAANQGLVLSP